MNSRDKLLVFSICSLLLIVSACASSPTGRSGADGNSAGASPTSGSTGGGFSGAPTISASDKPLDVMTKAMRAQLDAKSFRAHITSSAANGPDNKMVIEYVAPDRYRMVSEAQAGKGGAAAKVPGQEFIIVGNATFLKAPNGQWIKSPIDAGQMVKAFRDPKMLDELAKTADVKYVGAETLDGVPMLIYEYTQNNPMGMNLKSTARTWLSAADGLPRKTETAGEYNGVKTKTLITLSGYNTDIKIEPPVK